MNVVDLFCGCGGLSLGLQKSGMNIVQAFDNWDKSNEVYKKNFNHPIRELDLTDTDKAVESIKNINFDLIAGGPPCQDYSSAGKRNLSGGRADLTYKFSDIVFELKPKWFIMENVPLIKNSYILNEIITELEKIYGLNSFVLDASYFNVPQSRKRYFLIGRLNGKHNELINEFKSVVSDKQMTVKDYFGSSLKIQHYYRHPRNYNRRGIFSVNEPSPTIRGVNRPIPPNYSINGIVPDGIDLSKVRALTFKERSMIQTFPKDFIFEGTKTNLELMIGNAVPVNLSKAVGSIILEFDNKIKNLKPTNSINPPLEFHKIP